MTCQDDIGGSAATSEDETRVNGAFRGFAGLKAAHSHGPYDGGRFRGDSRPSAPRFLEEIPVIRQLSLARALAGAALVGLLSACATVTNAPDPSKTAPTAEQGVVVISVTGNTAQVNQFDQITLRKLPGPGGPQSNVREQHILRQVSKGLARDTSLFVGSLPEGEYALERMVDVDTQRSLYLAEGGRRLIGNFRVKAGALIDLGRLIVTPVNTKVIVGRSGRVPSNAPLVKRFAREHEQFYAREVLPGWIEPRNSDDRVEEYALTRPVGADGIAELPDGELAAASRLGTVLLRDKQGRWRPARSGGLESLLWLKPLDSPDTLLVAVGEFSTLLRLDKPSGKLLPMDTGNLPAGNLIFIDGNAQAGWFIAQQSGSEVTLYRSAVLDRGDWKALRKEDVSRSFWSGANSFWAWSTANGFAYAVSQGSIWYYDFADSLFTERHAPNNNRLTTIAPSANGALGILTSPGGGFGGVFATMYLSRDGAASWEEIKSPFNVKIAPPRLTQQGTMLVTGGAFGKPELHASKDGGKTWSKVSEGVVELTEQIVVLSSGGLLAVDAGSRFGLAHIRHSADEGTTWRTEYSNFDRAFYDAEQKRKEEKK
jgi:hypothetical protein